MSDRNVTSRWLTLRWLALGAAAGAAVSLALDQTGIQGPWQITALLFVLASLVAMLAIAWWMHRRDRQVQPIEQPGLEKGRDRDPATLDEHAVATAPAEQLQQRGRRAAGHRLGQAYDRGGANVRLALGHVLVTARVQGRGGAVGEHPELGGQAPRWIEDDTQRMRARYEARRELGIVGGHRPGADDDGIAETP